MKISKFAQPIPILILLILLGAFFRFSYINWDNFGAYHPDERNISWAVTRITFFSQLDPKFFAYGGLPIYLYRALGEGIVRLTENPIWLYDWGHIAIIGRYVSAMLSTISVGLIYIVGTLYFSPAVGLLSAALLTFSPWAIREAHFQTTETMLVFFILLLLIFSRKLKDKLTHKRSSTKNILWIGIIWGLAMAAKTTSLLFGIIPLTSLWLGLPHLSSGIKTWWHMAVQKIVITIAMCATSAIVFFCFSPYTIVDFQHYKESMVYESGVALGRFTVPYTLQFLHTTPYLYQLTTMLWQTGLLVFVGLAGLIAMIVAGVRSRHKEIIIFLIFPLIYFGWVGLWFAKFARYNVPFLPFLTIAAAWVCFELIKKVRVAGFGLTAVVLGTTMIWGVANFTIYVRPQTKVEATKWITRNIPTDAIIYTEHWNDGLPLDIPGVPSYKRELLNVYDEPDDAKKRSHLADKLSAGDYIIFSTRRIWATMPNLKQKYPVTSKFYTKILDGTLGYSEVATFTSYPQLFGRYIQDDAIEESIQVFDHPTVRIFQNTDHLSREEIVSRLVR